MVLVLFISDLLFLAAVTGGVSVFLKQIRAGHILPEHPSGGSGLSWNGEEP
jgi:hypothetical protein